MRIWKARVSCWKLWWSKPSSDSWRLQMERGFGAFSFGAFRCLWWLLFLSLSKPL